MSINTPEELRGQLRTLNVLDGDMSASGKIIASKIGQKGDTGDPGEAATIEVGTVTTVSPSTPASVTNVGTATNAVFNFEIPKGQDGSGGGGTWGSITGTLSDQTDLKNALDDKIGKSLTAGLVKNDGTIDTTTYSTFSGNYSDLTGTPTIPDELSDLSDDATHRLVTDDEKTAWNNKSDFSGNYSDLSGRPSINNGKLTIKRNGTQVGQFYANTATNYTADISVPTDTGDLTNGAGFLTSESDPVFTASAASGITATDISNWNGKSDFSGNYSDLNGKPIYPMPIMVAKSASEGGTLTITSSGEEVVIPIILRNSCNATNYLTLSSNKVTISGGIKKVLVSCQLTIGRGAGAYLSIVLKKNGTTLAFGRDYYVNWNANTMSIIPLLVDVQDNDYFEIYFSSSVADTYTINQGDNSCFMTIQAVEI